MNKLEAWKVYAEAIAPADSEYSNPGLLGRIKGHFRWLNLWTWSKEKIKKKEVNYE